MKSLLKSHVVQQLFGAVSWNVVGMAFSLVNGIITARLLAPDDRGLLALSLSISSLSLLVSTMGTHDAVRTHQPTKTWASFRTYLFVSTLLLVFNMGIVLLTVWTFIQLGYVDLNEHVVVITLLGMMTFTSSALLDLLNAAGRTSTSALADTIGHFSTMASLLLLASALPTWANLQGVLSCYILSYAARVGAMMLLTRNHSLDYGSFSLHQSKQFMRTSLKFWGIGLSRTLTFRSDQLLLGVFSNAYNIGLYAVAFTPASLMQVVSNSIGQVAYREAALGRISTKRLMQFIITGLSISTTYAIAMWMLAPFVMPLIFGEDYSGSVPVVRILLVASVILSPYSILIRVLAGMNSPYLATLTGVTGIVVLVPTMFFLATQYGAIGAAISTGFSYASMLSVAVICIIIRLRREYAT